MRWLVRWLLNALSLLAIAYIAPQLGILPGFRVESFEAAIVAVLILTLLNMTVRPLLMWLTLPVTCLTFGLFTLVINALMMLLTSALVTGFHVGSFGNAVVVSLLYAVVSGLLNTLFNKKED
ncbi:MAG TPA: phage holin family protein [Symbiobacteriaceae bacterium]